MREAGRGEVESSLTALHPYVAHAVTDRLSVWGAGGYGTGTLRLAPAGGVAVETDIDLAMAALGARATLRPAASDGLGLALKTDALWLRAGSDAASGLPSDDVGVTRLRLGLEGSQATRFRRRSTLTRSFELGLRHDGGGRRGRRRGGHRRRAFVAQRLRARSPWASRGACCSRMRAATSASGGCRGRSCSTRVRVRDAVCRSRCARRWASSTASQAGAALPGWEAATGREPGAGGGERRLDTEIAYGVALSGAPLVGVPHAALGLSGTGREYTLGWRLEWARPSRGERADFGVSMRRRDGAGREPEERVGLDLTLHW